MINGHERFIETSTDWSSLSDKQLGDSITKSFSALEVLSRQAQKEMRERMLPALQEVRQRFKDGKLVGGASGIEEFFRSLGINPATVRTWERRARLAAPKPPVVPEDTSEWTAEMTAEEFDSFRPFIETWLDADLAKKLANYKKKLKQQKVDFLAELAKRLQVVSA